MPALTNVHHEAFAIEMVKPVHGEFVNYAAIGIWNRPRQ
jgi:hypothetical protein